MPKQPFKKPPLRQAGDSGRHRVLNRLSNELVWLVGAMGLVGVIGGFNAGLRVGIDFGMLISRPIAWTIFAACLTKGWITNHRELLEQMPAGHIKGHFIPRIIASATSCCPELRPVIRQELKDLCRDRRSSEDVRRAADALNPLLDVG